MVQNQRQNFVVSTGLFVKATKKPRQRVICCLTILVLYECSICNMVFRCILQIRFEIRVNICQLTLKSRAYECQMRIFFCLLQYMRQLVLEVIRNNLQEKRFLKCLG